MIQMIEVKTAELIGPALDLAVAKAEGADCEKWFWDDNAAREYSPSTDWDQCGPLIDREGIDLRKRVTEGLERPNPRFAWKAEYVATNPYRCGEGPTPLIAAMRCLVAAKLGDTVQVPKELLP